MITKFPLLNKGDKIGIIAPSRMITEAQISRAIEMFGEWELEVVCGKSLYAHHGYFAGSDAERRADLQEMMDRPEIRAVFCARGGYGMTRIVDDLDFSKMLQVPKPMVGFSDITALHLALNKIGVESIHGLMPAQYDYLGIDESLASLKQILFTGAVNYKVPANVMNKPGTAVAEVIGGNLSLVAESIGTASEVETEGKILFLEEIDEYLYKIDRMLMQLRRAGKFRNLAGVIIGDFSQMKDTQIPFGKSIYELIGEHFNKLSIPIAYQFPIGHEPERNLAIPCGRTLALTVTKEGVTLTDRV